MRTAVRRTPEDLPIRRCQPCPPRSVDRGRLCKCWWTKKVEAAQTLQATQAAASLQGHCQNKSALAGKETDCAPTSFCVVLSSADWRTCRSFLPPHSPPTRLPDARACQLPTPTPAAHPHPHPPPPPSCQRSAETAGQQTSAVVPPPLAPAHAHTYAHAIPCDTPAIRLALFSPPPLSKLRDNPPAPRIPGRALHTNPDHQGRRRGHAQPAKIASYSKGHRSRNSLLGASAEGHYQPLSGASSFASTTHQPPLNASYSPGGYHDRQGLSAGNVGGGATLRENKMYIPRTKWTRAFFGIAIGQAVVALALEAFVFAEFQTSLGPNADPTVWKTIPTYLAIFMFGFFYELLLVWDALRLKNTIQVIGLCLYNLGMMTYSGVQIDQVNEAVLELGPNIDTGTWTYLRPCLIAVPCVLAAVTVLMSFVAWKLYGEFAWTIYKHISADLRLKRRFLTYQIYIALLKFDFFFFLGFAVQFLVIVKNNSDSELGITVAALPIIVGLLILAAFFVRRESYAGHAFIIALYLAAMAYFIFKLFRMWDSDRKAEYARGRSMLTTFAVFAIILLLTTIGTAVVVMMNFKKGLAPHIQTRKVPEADGGKYGGGYVPDNYPPGQAHALGAVPNRMTID